MHFSNHNPTHVVIGELTKFIDVKPPAVMEWLAGSRFPKGTELIRLRSFLTQIGYEVKEFISMPEDNQKFCLMVGFGVLGTDEVKQKLGYQDHQGVLDLALRGRFVIKARTNDFDRLLRENSERLEEALQAFRERIGKEMGNLVDHPDRDRPTPASPRHPSVRPQITPDNDHRLVVALAHNLHTASWLAEIVSGWDDRGLEMLGGVLSDRELDLIISRIEKLRHGAAAQSAE